MSVDAKVQVIGSDVAGKAPLATDIAVRELAVNTTDKELYTKTPLGTVVKLYDHKANLTSPSLTGLPTAPTQPTLTNDTTIATTAFVQGHVATLVARIASLEARVTLLEGTP